MIDRRMFAATMAACLLSTPALAAARQTPVRAQVFRSPDCGCCGAWIAHLEAHGFVVDVVMTEDMEAVKDRHGVPASLRSCHTGLIEGYVIEGHVPAADIHSLLEQHPQAGGIAVPGMPVGSPGMEMGDHRDPFDVILWTGSQTRVFSSHQG
ncbi:DUF411 domain-containing protein [Paracoccus liaowanqingii]|uniref:DUF411 domain-containing protein n=1 Tax=Paracoccus liaowanqingii TaxID=2560053 RepID=A0A4Z1C6L6_9RHOB|nr:DUF411 domain-containing protein [Paracoccus liaowanqingii]TGN52205.1 DUF411 domain-containing protein [Paracoccus liaowanqingii]